MTPYLWIIVVEPSPFRRDETYVIGPYRRRKALRVARAEMVKHPFGHAHVLPADAAVEQGEKQLW